jgi:hypothetical protein
MWPAVRDGALVEVEPVPAAELVVGDLAAFVRAGAVVVHRVAGVHAEGLLLTGDACRKSDGVILERDILGRARVLEQRALRLRTPTRRQVRLLFEWAIRSCRVKFRL